MEIKWKASTLNFTIAIFDFPVPGMTTVARTMLVSWVLTSTGAPTTILWVPRRNKPDHFHVASPGHHAEKISSTWMSCFYLKDDMFLTMIPILAYHRLFRISTSSTISDSAAYKISACSVKKWWSYSVSMAPGGTLNDIFLERYRSTGCQELQENT